MRYVKTVAKAIVPRKIHDILWVTVLASGLVWAGYQMLLQAPPQTVVHTETQWPRTVPRGGFFYLNFDVTFDRDCQITAHRYIRASDGVEYLAQEDVKEVKAGNRVKYTVTVPVGESLPIGPALIQSKFDYECNFWSRWVHTLTISGKARQFVITDPGTLPTLGGVSCILAPKPGFVTVQSYYRRDPRYLAQNDR